MRRSVPHDVRHRGPTKVAQRRGSRGESGGLDDRVPVNDGAARRQELGHRRRAVEVSVLS
ncbi:vegetative cell wall protein gp1 [Iris pallida]|uniref:Vegetative cell wall protein gp1 n=1 Tax=Iris pallida TaxID=29817 RepID=A0AAX6E722_IRIPA|nr:vegetative cell wall protein gp1 [Iris pallida]